MPCLKALSSCSSEPYQRFINGWSMASCCCHSFDWASQDAHNTRRSGHPASIWFSVSQVFPPSMSRFFVSIALLLRFPNDFISSSRFRDCTGPNVSTLVGTDFCDRDDVQKMLTQSGSDRVKCIYNPGPSKNIRISRACDSSSPGVVDQYKSVVASLFSETQLKVVHPNWVFHPRPDGDSNINIHSIMHSYWTIGQGQNMRLPVVHNGSGSVMLYPRANAILYCRVLFDHNCVDHPLRGASRTAKIFIDGAEVNMHFVYLCCNNN